MNRFWEPVLRPLLEAAEPDVVIEVGADRGATTLMLLPWAETHGVRVHVVDPNPRLDVDDIAREFGSVLEFHRLPSLLALPKIVPVDIVLLDGDHNWFTVTQELRTLFEGARRAGAVPPIVAAHDVGWPYGRRDLYYEPERIPETQRHPYARRGMAPGTRTLVDGGFNNDLFNAAEDGGPRNGVRTAIEDFIRGEAEDCTYLEIPGFHGLGIVVPTRRLERRAVARQIEHLQSPEFLVEHTQRIETERLELEWRRRQTASALEATKRRLAEAEEAAEDTLAQLQRTTEQRDEAATELTTTNRALAAAQAELENSAERARLANESAKIEFRGQAVELAAARTKLDRALARAQAAETSAERNAEKARELEVASAEADADRQRTDRELESARQRLEATLAQAASDHEAATRERLAQGEELAELQRSHRALRGARTRLRGELTSLREEVNQLRAAAEQRNADLSRRADDEARLLAELASRDEGLERARREVRNLNRELATVNLVADRLGTRGQELERAAALADEQRDALEREVAQLKQATMRHQAQAEQVVGQLVEDRKRVADLARRLERSRSWRLGHGVFVLLRRLTLRRARGRSVIELILERSDPPVSFGRPAQSAETDIPARIERAPAALARAAADADGVSEETLRRLAQACDTTIVIPIHNAADDLGRCLYSVVRHTAGDARLLLIDDASSDPEVQRILSVYAELPGVQVLGNAENIGFTRTVNRGLAESEGDVVLLNSDVVVGPRWLESLREAAYSAEDIGTVTPISNNAGAFSVPRVGQDNPSPGGLSHEQVSRLIAQVSERRLPATPTGNGFCMYLKRQMVHQVGPFDAKRFPIGYGEENDLCMRASSAGWRHVVDDRAYVHHVRSSSFGDRKAQLMADGRKTLDKLHPSYTDEVRRFVNADDIRAVRANVDWAFAQVGPRTAVRPRVLFVLHEGRGGTPSTNLDLMRALQRSYEPFALTADGRRMRLFAVVEGALELLDTWTHDEPWSPMRFSDASYRRVAADVLSRYAIELVHIRHLFKHSLDLPGIARALSIPVILSVHDYYTTCPTVHLIDERGVHCGGECTPGDGTCLQVSELLSDVPPLKHRWVHSWRQAMRRQVISQVDAMVTTSEYTRALHQRVFPEAPPIFEVIEHGRDLVVSGSSSAAPRPGERIRVLLPGNLDVHKGADVIRVLHELDAEAQRLELHFLGETPAAYAELGVSHGTYVRSEFDARVRQIGPHVIAILSIWPETYCHTLSEAWATGVPVIAADTGALHERITRHGGGWLVPPGDARAVYEVLLGLADDPAAYQAVAGAQPVAGIRQVSAMADDYDRLYREVLARRCRFRPIQSGRGPASLSTDVLRAAVFCPGRPGSAPGSSHVRVLRRLSHPDIAWKLSASYPMGRSAASLPDGCDLAIVQRTAIAPEDVEPFLERLAQQQTPLLVELDDDLLSFSEDHAEYGRFVAPLRALLDAASTITVSTEALRARLADHRDAVVVPNMLDERLWASPVEPEAQLERPSVGLQLVYIGTRTHAADLAPMRDVLEALRAEAGIDCDLEVVGGEPSGPGQDWYRRIEIPSGARDYPSFVAWLRARAGRWDIALAPLSDGPINDTKSDLKFLEYSALGLPGVYSAGCAYSGCGDGDRAMVVANSRTDWVAAIDGLAGNAERRHSMAEAAKEHVLRHRMISCDAARYLDLLSTAAGAARPTGASVASASE